MTNVDIIYPMQLYNIQLMQPQDNFGYRPRTGRVSTASVPGREIRKRPTKWVRPPSQRGKDDPRIGWKKKTLI